MNIDMTRPIDRDAWLTALHAKGASDERLASDLDKGERMLKSAVRPKAVYKLIRKSDFRAKGVSVKKHLEGCHEVTLMAVTLGVGVDELIRRTQITDMALAVVLDTGASVLIEQLADEFQQYIKADLTDTEAGKPAVFMTTRFSPGYGDWSVSEQTHVLRTLDAQRRIGLNITSDSLMIPRKSITAVIGIADHPVKGAFATCSECVIKDKCELKKEGKFCGREF